MFEYCRLAIPADHRALAPAGVLRHDGRLMLVHDETYTDTPNHVTLCSLAGWEDEGVFVTVPTAFTRSLSATEHAEACELERTFWDRADYAEANA